MNKHLILAKLSIESKACAVLSLPDHLSVWSTGLKIVFISFSLFEFFGKDCMSTEF